MTQSGIADLGEYVDARVLIVDDVQVNTSLLEKILTRAGLGDVRVCNDSRDVPTLLVDYGPDLIILDLHMPHLDGFALLDVIGRHAAGQFLPVLVLTADTTDDAAYRALQLGAHDMLTKPFDAVIATLRVRNLLRTRATYQELRRHNALLSARVSEQPTGAVEPFDVRRRRIEQVLASGGPTLAFQPIIDLRDDVSVGYEALSRFSHEPARGPDVWFAEAHDVGLGIELELAALRNSLAHVEHLSARQFLSLNASPAAVLADLRVQLGDGVPWERIIVELTEHSPIEDYTRIREAIQDLRSAGAGLSVDDTGAGFASLRHILHLEPDYVKLDISLCRGIDHDLTRQALARALVAFASAVGIVIVAEGIETVEERDTLRSLGIDHGQGYLLGRPGPLPAVSPASG